MMSTLLPVMMIAAYLIGGIPFGFLVARAKGVDIRKHGSGNIGASNVGRTLGRPYGIAVLILDAGKCFSVMTIARLWAASMDWPYPGLDTAWLLAATGLCAILGNVFPVYLKFRGGKAVAASVGVFVSVWPDLGVPVVVALLVWVITVKTSRYIAVASLAAALSHPLALLATLKLMDRPIAELYPLLVLSALLAVIVCVRHRTNIVRLLAGQEEKTGEPDRVAGGG
jgi:glycerol-3-phosphate acyltransferase PlsY